VKLFGFFALLICSIFGNSSSLTAQASKRLALVDLESDFLSPEDKAQALNLLSQRFRDLRTLSTMRMDEVHAKLQQKNKVRAEVEKVRAGQANKKIEIERSLEEAQKYYLASQFEEAITLLNGSLLALNAAALVMNPELPTAILKLLAASHYFQGNEPQARFQISALLDLDPSALIDAQKYPPNFIELFNQIKAETRQSWEVLQLASNVKGIRGHFMGHKIEITEGETIGLRLPVRNPFWGSKAVVLEADNFAPILFALDRPPTSLEFVSIEDQKTSTSGLLRPIGNSTAPMELKKLVLLLGADVVFLGALERAENGRLQMSGQWLEEPSGRSSPVVRVAARDIPNVVEKLVSEMLDYISPDGAVLGEKFVPYEERPEMAVGKPFYKTWWFWTIAGAAIVGTGVGTYLLLNQSDTVRVRVSPAP